MSKWQYVKDAFQSHAWDEITKAGAAAKRKGLPETSCPYWWTVSTDSDYWKRAAWMEGYHQ